MKRSWVTAGLAVAALFCFLPDANSRTWYVKVDGTGDAPTLQAAVDSISQDDTILVAPGVYTWANQGGGTTPGMIFVPRLTPDFVFISEAGRLQTILDAQGQGRILGLEAETLMTIDGFTFTNGIGTEWPGTAHAGGAIWSHLTFPVIRHCIFRFNEASHGGAIWYGGVGAVTIEDCVFAFNSATNAGGAMYLINSPRTELLSVIRRCTIRDNSVTGTETLFGGGAIWAYNIFFRVEQCLIYRNSATAQGGAFDVSRCGPNTIKRCTIAENEAPTGSAIAGTGYATLSVENCILSQNVGGDPVSMTSVDQIDLSCCDLWANSPGNWTGGIADQKDQNGNFTANPHYCSPAEALYGLNADSPCAAGNHPAGANCGLIGRRIVLCGTVPVEQKSWGSIKSLYEKKQ